MSNTNTDKRKIVAANMWSIWNFGDANERYQNFLSRGKPEFSNFIENTLLYEEVYVPTQDYLSLTILLGVLGEDSIQELLSCGTLKFVRVKGGLSYVGNGVGITPYTMFTDMAKSQPQAFCSDVDYAVNWAINGLNTKPKDKKLYQKIIENSIEIDIDEIAETIKSETYKDILSSEQLQNFFALRNKDLNNLIGIAPNQVRTYGGKDTNTWTGDEIDNYLLLINTNLELKLLEFTNCTDMTTSNPVGHMLKAKFSREIGINNNTSAMTSLKEIADIPDFGELVLSKQIKYSDLLELKMSKIGADFRECFHKNCNGDEKQIAKEFIKLIQGSPKVNSIPIKILRFIITTGLGFIPIAGAVIGAGAGIIDSFFLEKWAKGHSPKFFIDDIKQLNNR